MKLRRTWMMFAVCGMTAVVLDRWAMAAEQQDYKIYVAKPTISNYVIRPGQPLPPNWQAESTLRLTACRDEREPASFVIESDQPLKMVNIESSELVGAQGKIKADAVDIRVVAPVFRRITDWPGTLNWVLVHDPNLIKIADEPEPGALTADSPVGRAYVKTTIFTREPVDTATLQPADVDNRQQFWLTVHVPPSTKSGTYRGTLTITCQNGPKKELAIELTVPEFDLLPPAFEYSVYYPTWLEGGELKSGNASNYAVLSTAQYLAELRNMAEHGCFNPNIYDGPKLNDRGALDFTHLEKVIALRHEAGLRGGPLYLANAGPVASSTKIDEQKKQANTRWVRQIVDWARQHGHNSVYVMGHDEATGAQLTGQREAWRSIHDGGGKVFVANYGDFAALVGDVLDLPILMHPLQRELDKLSLMPAAEFLSSPPEVGRAVAPEALLTPEYQKTISTVHKNDFRIFTYMDPLAGYTLPETHRRMRGLQLWKANLDGTMTWAYTHITQQPHTEAGRMQWHGIFAFVLRGKEQPFDTLAWEAYREGYDDARYLATLQAELRKAPSSEKHRKLAQETNVWLANISSVADLDQWRQEMIQRMNQLLDNQRQ